MDSNSSGAYASRPSISTFPPRKYSAAAPLASPYSPSDMLHPHWQSGSGTPSGSGSAPRPHRSRANSGDNSASDDSPGRRSRRQGVTERPVSRLPSPNSKDERVWMVVRTMTDHSYRLELRPRMEYTPEELLLTDVYVCRTVEDDKQVWHSACKRTDGFSPSTCDEGYHSINPLTDVATTPISLTDKHPYAMSILPWDHPDINLDAEVLLRNGASVEAFIDANADARAESLERYEIWQSRAAYRRSWQRLNVESHAITELKSRIAELDGHCTQATKVVQEAHEKLRNHRLTLDQPDTETEINLSAAGSNLGDAEQYLGHLEGVRNSIRALKGGSESSTKRLNSIHQASSLAVENFRTLYNEVKFGISEARRTNYSQKMAAISVSEVSFDLLHERLDGVKNAKVQLQSQLEELEHELEQKKTDQASMTDTARSQALANKDLLKALKRAEARTSRAEERRKRAEDEAYELGGGGAYGTSSGEYSLRDDR
ncbi:hypothetical protein L198_06797 [Cryptococcus wingfieldii CBS 7118]|uniref:Uncharacterized protein n=1 Tax=Cryptococcus wingfieldii CBS 7118 TaxID=1295528 RepID=A0A1E3IHI2_9TREE|nr:hypothetical protein L198_06797 [Cryptococcus wingfieldii CBS 7118]ODN88053.1 hypothetical protein L198_06797 [Cryptococcus wingfieldii CBS 7118]